MAKDRKTVKKSINQYRMISAPSFCASILAGAKPLRSRNDKRRIAPRAEKGLSPPVATCCGDSNFFRLEYTISSINNQSISDR